MSRECSIDVSGDGTVLWRLLSEKENNMQIKTHQKNINYNMLGLRLRRLALGSVHCPKFNKTQQSWELQTTAGIDLSTSAHLGRSESGRRSTHTHSTCVPGQGSADAAIPQRFLDASTAQAHSWYLTTAGVPGSCKQQLPKMLPLRFSLGNHSSSPLQKLARENRWVWALGSVTQENMRERRNRSYMSWDFSMRKVELWHHQFQMPWTSAKLNSKKKGL